MQAQLRGLVSLLVEKRVINGEELSSAAAAVAESPRCSRNPGGRVLQPLLPLSLPI